jgi:solute carrier family 25 protein 39/40
MELAWQVGIYLPCYDVLRELMEDAANEHAPHLAAYTPFVAGSLARSVACIACSPLELARTRMQVCFRCLLLHVL